MQWPLTLVLIQNELTLPNEENLESKLKAFEDDMINFIEMIISLSYRVENIVGKGENAGYQYFSSFHNVFKSFFFRVIKSQDCVVKS